MASLVMTWRSNLLHRLRHLPRQCYSTTRTSSKDDLLRLPLTASDWKEKFPHAVDTRNRVSVRNPETAALMANAFVPMGSKDKIIVEAFPGPGTLTRALLDLPKGRIQKIIVLEDWPPYLEYLLPLQEYDSRVEVVPINGHAWGSYQQLMESSLKDVPTVPWTTLHPNLHFIAHVPSTVLGEQLVAQLFRAIPERQWLFSYGRIPMSFILSKHVYDRLVATGTQGARCKVSVVAESTAQVKEAVPYDLLQPFDDNFHPAASTAFTDVRRSTKTAGKPFTTANVTALEKQVIKKGQMDAWDYILRRMFVKKASKIEAVLPGVAPGARILLKMITDPNLPPLDVKKTVRTLTPSEWAIVLKAFAEWPFAPEDLGMQDVFEKHGRHDSR